MLPPILQALQMGQSQHPQPQQNQSQLSAKLQEAAKMYRGIQNPQQYLQNEIMKNNPLVKNAMQEIQANGGNAQAAFYNYAQQLGVNPNEIIAMLQGK